MYEDVLSAMIKKVKTDEAKSMLSEALVLYEHSGYFNEEDWDEMLEDYS